MCGARVGEQYVGRFDVAVHQAAFVGEVEGFGDGADDLQSLGAGKPARMVVVHESCRGDALDVAHQDP